MRKRLIAAAAILAAIVTLIVATSGDASTEQRVAQGVATFSVGPTDVASTGLDTTIGDVHFTRQGFGIEAFIVFEVEVTVGDLDDFKLMLQDHPGGQWYAYLSGTDWDTATSNNTFVFSTAPNDVTSGGFSHAHVRVPCHAFRFDAIGTNGALATVRGTYTNR